MEMDWICWFFFNWCTGRNNKKWTRYETYSQSINIEGMESNCLFQIVHSIRIHLIVCHSCKNIALKEVNKVETTMHKIETLLWIWFLLKLSAQYSIYDFFETKTKDGCNDFLNPPQFGKYTSKKRFPRNMRCLLLTNNPPPAYHNCCSMIRDLVILLMTARKPFLIPLGTLVLMSPWFHFWMGFSQLGVCQMQSTPIW